MANRKPNRSIDEKIKMAEAALVKSKARYDSDAAVLKDLLQKKEVMKQKELLDAMAKSKRSFHEILSFVNSDPNVD